MRTQENLINDDEYVTVCKCGNYTEIIHCRQDTKPVPVTKVSKNLYIDHNSGEEKSYNYSEVKSLENFKKQFKNIPRIVKGYFNGDNTERFITLTYSYIMDNPYILQYDFKKFIKKVGRRYGKCRYLYIKEPNNKGSWHIHSIIKRLDEMPFNISVDIIRTLWGKGYAVSVDIPYNINTLPYYFDISVNEDKRARVMYYPPFIKIYGYSKDMKIEKTKEVYKDAKPSNMTKIYDSENQYIDVNRDDGEIVSHWKTVYEQYKAL